MRSHLAGTDAAFEMKYRDITGALADPSAQVWSVYDNSGTVVDSYTEEDTGNVTQTDVGVWMLVYPIPADARGVWMVTAEGTVGLVEKARISFSICR